MHPILFEIGPVHIYTYGALLASAFLIGIWFTMRSAEREGVKSEFIADMGIIIIVSSIVGARLFYILFYAFRYTLEHPRELLKLQQTGLVFYGGLFFAVAGGIIFCKIKRVSATLVMDIIAPSIALGQSIGRIGCFMSGCCYGKPTQVFWGVNFPHLVYSRHPTQIYESIAAFSIFLALLWFRERKTRVGQTAWLYLVLYASARFALEFLRGDNPHVLFELTISQILSLLALIGALPLGYFLWIRSPEERPLASGAETSDGGPND